VRLLTDEHYATDIAIRLRAAGHDAVAVLELEMTGAADEALLAFAAAQGRVLLTNNVRDFAALAALWARGGQEHFGLLFTSDESLPRGCGTIGLYLEVLGALLDAHPAADALRNQVRWVARPMV
jgi:predicted nuclease of predicted toxin-antitoxin system